MTKLDDLFRFSQNALNLHAHRQQLIASNIANADTPGYKARDIDFAAALKSAEAAAQGKAALPAQMRSDESTPLGAELLYRSAVQRSVDGNTVDLDVERAQFAENSVRYEAQLMFINSRIKSMLAAIQG
ncbi:MAG TPA: flagellar basal body rod protein FlgB [Burkholderiales bacterium]|nr:flagellar basal body rod protein FlgB [Burkholderiales bacterium]